jgi:hypothetical protein
MVDDLEPRETGSRAAESSTAPLPVAAAGGAAAPAGGAGRVWRAIDRGPQGKPWRILTIVLLVVGCVLAPIGVTAAWAKNLVVDQTAYLEAVEPLITDPVIVQAMENRTVSAIDEAISNLQLAETINDELQALGLPPKLATLATGYLATFRADITDAITKMVGELFQSPKLAELWNRANAATHTKFVQVMQGQEGQLHALNVDLSNAVAQVKQKLESSGVSWAAQIPDIPVVINLAGNADVQMVAGYYDLLDTVGTWLPILVVILLLLSILIAPSRLGGLSKAAGWLAVSMVVLTIGLIAGREWVISQAPTQPQVTQAFVSQLTVNLTSTIKFILVLSAVIAVVAWLFGRSRSAVGVRREVRGLAGLVRDSRWHLAVRIVAAVLALAALLVLFNLQNPGVLSAVSLAVLAGLAALVAVSPQRGDPDDPTPADPAAVNPPADGPSTKVTADATG